MKLLLCWTLPVCAVDQVTKALVAWRFPMPGNADVITIIPRWFQIHRLHNSGMHFGLANGWEHSNNLFLVLSLGAVAFLVWLLRSGGVHDRWSGISIAVLIGGILGNATDRLARGYVIDFLRLDCGPQGIGTFNLADVAIWVGAALLLLRALRAAQ